MNERRVILDSGAYTAWRKNKPIELSEYMAFLKKHDKIFPQRFTLDVIQNSKASFENWMKLRDAGFDTIPVYHLQSDDEKGDDKNYLQKYLKHTDHIAIGAIANMSTVQRQEGLDHVWKHHLADKDGNPKYKVHGLGLTAIDIMTRYPWHSVDSNSPTLAAAFGKVYLPKVQYDGAMKFAELRMVSISDQSKHKSGTIGSYISEPVLNKKYYEKLFKELGFTLGQIQNVERRVTRKDKKNNREIMTPLLELDLTTSQHNGETLANSWEERLRWNLVVWNKMFEELPYHKFSDGEPYQTKVYSVCSSAGHLGVFEKLPEHPKMLVSYAYLRSNKTYQKQVIKYQER